MHALVYLHVHISLVLGNGCDVNTYSLCVCVCGLVSALLKMIYCRYNNELHVGWYIICITSLKYFVAYENM